MKKTVGQILREARESKEISLQDAARLTHIRLRYLQELEDDHPEFLPSKPQAKGFIRLYAAFLEIDAEELLSLWQEEDKSQTIEDATEDKDEEEPSSESDLVSVDKSDDEQEEIVEEIEGKQKDNIVSKLKSQLSSKLQLLKKDKKSTKKQKPSKKKKEKKEFASKETLQEKLSSLDIFREVGNQMRNRREKLGLSISDIEQFTKLRRIYITAIEEGRFDDLPSSVQGRGMVKNYADFLEMDSVAVLNLFADGLEVKRNEKFEKAWAEKEEKRRIKITLPPFLKRILSPDLLLGSALIISLFIFIIWGASQIFAPDSEIDQPTDAPSISEVLQTTATPESEENLQQNVTSEDGTEAGIQNTQQVLETVQPTQIATVNNAPLQLYIIAQQRAYLKVTVDGVVEFEERIVPGNAYPFSGQNKISLLCGNGAALEVYFNQEYLGKLGEVGEVINLEFDLDGFTIPAPSPTPDRTPTASPTASPSPTEEVDNMDGMGDGI